MFRDAEIYLSRWVNKSNRKPLIIRGSRQVGKSYLVRKFAKSVGRQLLEINFEQVPQLESLFASRQPDKIIRLLEMHFGVTIEPQSALLFLDEIQAAPTILQTLRYFYEQKPQIPVIAAGSLLEFVLADHDFSMPVGRIEYLHLEPMSFSEFLCALGKEKYSTYIAGYSWEEDLPDFVHQELMSLIKTYCIVGGMPEVVSHYKKEFSFVQCAAIQEGIMTTFRDDFSKYKKRIINSDDLRKVFQKIPLLLGTKFKYSHVDREMRSLEIKKSLDLLCQARVIHKVVHSDGNGIPLGAQTDEKDFKVIFLDIGLVSSSLKLNVLGLDNIENLALVNAGAISEQLVGQLLRHNREFYEEPQLYCWMRQKRQSSAEVDYLISLGQRVLPIEVKAGKTGALKSLHFFVREKGLPIAIRFNSDRPSVVKISTSLVGDNVKFNLVSLPFYLISRMPALVENLD